MWPDAYLGRGLMEESRGAVSPPVVLNLASRLVE